MKTKETEVLIIGAGFAGLSAALKLKENGISSLILEARNRVGGRTKTRYLESGLQIDLGGQWIGPTQDRMYELVNKYQIDLFPTQLFGAAQYMVNGLPIEDVPAEAYAIMNEIDRLIESINLENPMLSPNAEEYDKITFLEWIRSHTSDDVIVEFINRIITGALLTVDSCEISLLQGLYYVASGQGVKILTSAEGGAQQDRLVGGPQELASRMADDLGREHIFFNAEVVRIDHCDTCVTVHTSDHRIFKAKKVIICTPPVVTNSYIRFFPPLPVKKQRTIQNQLPGRALKYHAVYSRPFWRDKGLSGQTLTTDGYITETIDNSVPGHPEGIITFFVYGFSTDIVQADKEVRKEILLKELAVMYGDEALDALDLIEYNWQDKAYTQGCFAAHFPTGGFILYSDQVRKPVGSIHWAGTETATVWNGYFEGAVRSGEREALLITEALKSDTPSI
ncbi:FAD-dependent oxidoreductase [Apibacter raozihei]|uniref:flavin monoamine oxidase family protein n=1 Tax=Apibacter raozihei TaxID=2500547 RepID=UPI000FE2B5B9|nr:FAD-dependent oxidoreductase [Apibacter raozihei]